ncbi:MAG: pentapeptide repeat-containing protein, partial [Candidatus Thiodiazotropha taylori]|nr:pentapeptide repeat-containing protein [Candidatus Thiodiazotropha taylori]
MVPEAFFVKTAVDLIKSLSRTLVDLRNERKDEINRIEKTFGNLNYLVPYYVVPNAQNVNPADFEEDDTGLIAKNNIFNLLDSFLSGPPRYNHAFVLSDAGMGKTSLLVMLELFYINKFIQKNFEVKLFKLAPETIDEISEIDSPHNTVLLLDALDEDQDAWENFYNRLQLILQATKSFRKVVITCRTQFFPIEHEEDGRIPGVVVLSGFHCSKIFLSPFTDEQVDEYLQKRFPDPESINKAKKIVSRMNSLKFRPMLLSYVDYFLDSKQEFNDALTVYKILVDEWLNRELRKGVISDKKEIFNACTKIAVYMYSKKKRAIEFGEVRDSYMTLKSFRSLEYMTIEGRSLLHRNSEGNYKFAHYSILEYFVAKHLISNPTPEQNTDQVIRFIEDMLIHHGEKKASGLNINNIQLQESRLKKINFSESSITGGIFRNSTLDRSDFSRVNSKNMNFDHCSLYYTNFSGAVIDSSIFRSSVPSLSNFDDSKFTQTEFDSSNFKGSTFNNTSLLRCKISDCSLVDSTLNQTDFTGSDLTDSIIKTDIIKKCTFTNAVLVT